MNRSSAVDEAVAVDLPAKIEAAEGGWTTGRRAVASTASPRLMIAPTGGALVLVAFEFLQPTAAASATMYATIETVLTLFALAAAWLLRAHFLQTLRRSDLMLLAGVLTFGLVHLFACAAPAALNASTSGRLAATAICGELFVATMFAAAALVPRDQLALTLHHPARAVIAVGLFSVGVAGLAALMIVNGHGLTRTGGSVHHVPALVLDAVTAALFTFTAIALARAGRRGRDRGSLLLAGGVGLLVVALLAQLAAPFRLDPDSPTEALRVLGFGLVLAAALDWEVQARRLAARAAAIAERQRVARDLHDGLAQDLAFIAAHGQRIAAEFGTEHPVVTAARRALQLSRCAIAELSDPTDVDAHEALEAIACELRARFEIVIALDVRLVRKLAPEVQGHVGRIVREAIANAARHGSARNVAVSLTDADGVVRLRVRDDGTGLESTGARRPHEGFGLRSIRERVTVLGGYVTLGQTGHAGTVLDVVLS